jgi:hypothetical protein
MINASEGPLSIATEQIKRPPPEEGGAFGPASV